MTKKDIREDNSGISPVIGVILMVAITVALAAVLGALVFNLGENQNSNVNAGVEINETNEGVVVNVIDMGNADQVEVSIDGNVVTTLSGAGQSTTLATNKGSTITVIGITSGSDGSSSSSSNSTVLSSTTSSSDTTGASGNSGIINTSGESPFIITVNTENNGDTANNEFRINTGDSSYNYDYDVSTDGSVANSESDLQNVSGDLVLEYDTSGTYQVEISGKLPHLTYYRAFGSDGPKIESIDQWGTIEWKDMTEMFYEAENVEANYIDTPDTSEVTSMSHTFEDAKNFNADVSDWDVSNVQTMDYMFYNATSFNNGGEPLDWNDTSNVTTMRATFGIFDLSGGVFNQDVSSFDTSSVENMRAMFDGQKNFNQDVSMWDVSKVTTMENMFSSAESFNNDGKPLDWSDTGEVTTTSNMFNTANNFNQDVSMWDVSKVTTMSGMFAGYGDPDTSFNNGGEPLDWTDTSSVNNMNRMFVEAENFNKDISSWCVSQISSEPFEFDTDAGFDGQTSKQPNWGDTC